MEKLIPKPPLDPFREGVVGRLKTVKGHITGIEKMVGEGKSCQEILVQIAAVRSSIHKVGLMIVEENALSCLTGVQDGESVDAARFQEAVQIIMNYLK